MTRGHENPAKFLGDWEGFLHTDGWQAYHILGDSVMSVGCWFHARQPFEKIYKNTPKDKRKGSNAETALAYINALFKLEREYAELSPEERYEKRIEQSKLISDAFFAWAEGLNAVPKTPLGEAVGYALNQRKYLENVWIDGRLELSNNRAERAVKPFVIGRKNWLFSCSQAGARASSVMYSLVETAKLNGLNPRRYLEFLLETLPNSTTTDLEQLLPWSASLPESCKQKTPSQS